MKKLITMLSGVVLALAAFGSETLTQRSMTISTTGPDYYADGTPVRVGETYLLVYLKAGATFQGVRMDRTLVDSVSNTIAATAQAIAGSRCEFKAIQYPADLYPANGKWVIVLLDTRKADGVVGGLTAVYGASAAATAGDVVNLSVAATSGGSPTLSAASPAAAPAGVGTPVITGIKPDGASAKITFTNVTDTAIYEVQVKPDLASGSWSPAAGGKLLQGSGVSALSADVPAAPADGSVRFFRVVIGTTVQK